MASISASSEAWLPKNVLDMIIEKLVSTSDCVRFSLVCKSWRSAAIENFKLQSLNKRRHDNLHRRQIPLLMIPTDDNSRERRGLYGVTKNKVSEQQLNVPYAKRCCGSSHGWLFTIDETMSLSLLNPFSGAVIRLPALIGFYETPLVQQEQEDAFNHTEVGSEFEDDNGSDNNEGNEEEDEEEEDEEEDEEEEDEEEEDEGEDEEEEDDEDENELEDEDEDEGDNGINDDGEEEEDYDIIDSDEDNQEGFYSDDEVDMNYEYTIHKAVLSKDPDLYPHDYAVMVIYGNMKRLAFIKAGDKHWTFLHPKLQVYCDVLYSQERFLCLRNWGDIWSCDITKSPPKVEKITHAAKRYPFVEHSYFVQLPMECELAFVQRMLDGNLKTCGFKVMKRQIKEEQTKWVETSDLGGAALFLGGNYSASVLASDYPGCQPNCIYFTDDFADFFVRGTPYGNCGGGGPCDNGFYNLKEGTFGKHYELGPSQAHMPPPIWVIPKFK